MKKAISLFLLTVILFSFKTGGYEDKKYSVSLSQNDWSSRYIWVTVAMQQLKKSNLPSNEVIPLCDSLLKFTNELATQLQPQFLAQAKQDSIQKAHQK